MNSETEKIKNADRNPVQNIDKIIVELNTIATQNNNSNISIQWDVARDSVGPCLHMLVKFTHPEDCLSFSNYVNELQKAADHHSNFVMDNFHTVNILLSTHQPVPAITTVDFLFARALMNHLDCT